MAYLILAKGGEAVADPYFENGPDSERNPEAESCVGCRDNVTKAEAYSLNCTKI